MMPTIKLNRQQLENSIQLLKAKIALREQYLYCLKAKGTEERELITVAAFHTGIQANATNQLQRYLHAQKKLIEAQAEIEQVVIMELKSQLAIEEAMLIQGDRNVIVPPGSLKV